MTETWEDEGGSIEEIEDWPYDEEVDDDLVHELLEEWSEIDDVDEWKYVDE